VVRITVNQLGTDFAFLIKVFIQASQSPVMSVVVLKCRQLVGKKDVDASQTKKQYVLIHPTLVIIAPNAPRLICIMVNAISVKNVSWFVKMELQLVLPMQAMPVRSPYVSTKLPILAV